MTPVTGVDISQFNGDVDIATLKKHVGFVIIRCGYGSDYGSQDDTQYRQNVKKCEELGMPYGVYLYSYAKNTGMAESEAAHTLRLLDGRKPIYGVWYDVEDSTLPNSDELIDNCIAYCSAIEKAGCHCGIYSSLYFWNQRLNSPRLNRFDRWVAQWADDLTFSKPYGMWQYTNKGLIAGKQFDMDRAYKDYPALTRPQGDDIDMTKDEVLALIKTEAQKIYDENEHKYPTISAVPAWVKADVEQVYGELQLAGTGGGTGGNTKIDASDTYLRMIHIVAKLLDRINSTEQAAPAES